MFFMVWRWVLEGGAAGVALAVASGFVATDLKNAAGVWKEFAEFGVGLMGVACAATWENREDGIEERLTRDIFLIEECAANDGAGGGVNRDACDDLGACGDEVLEIFVVNDSKPLGEKVVPKWIDADFGKLFGEFLDGTGIER